MILRGACGVNAVWPLAPLCISEKYGKAVPCRQQMKRGFTAKRQRIRYGCEGVWFAFALLRRRRAMPAAGESGALATAATKQQARHKGKAVCQLAYEAMQPKR
ncbi:hypothetical protein NPIL_605341 [Nephila pilipes]|uniref:Uncharacterized protein n=1 Tax=Nephila pilipes TaxID=299642 RepID=A0A8X6PHT1_NEPPI|nr:hypothetical protein NPIL_605341 [Nephila pilipes]